MCLVLIDTFPNGAAVPGPHEISSVFEALQLAIYMLDQRLRDNNIRTIF